ncbi:DUF255 domain-containing protein [Marinobacterium jannaschii]|uniref:DUF255 domain-containing protein n=1 Tax=Marinobacterium jannaschii TaxID=64970 RepID=UPI0004894014|nr:DUF255 domain-containing protein [Marinobacterium jannaschii]
MGQDAKIHRFSAGLLLTALLGLSGLISAAQAASFGHKDGVDWQRWEKAAFDKARAENKLILINVGMEGCTACNRMERVTYRNQAVIDRINRDFVAIAVDAQARPDIGERYSDWAWPATAFLLPDTTQVFATAGNRLPRNFIPLLEDLATQHRKGELKADPNAPYATAPEPVSSELSLIRDQVRLQLDRAFNEETGGWGRWGVNTEVTGPRMLHLYYRAHLYDNQALRDSALQVSESFLRTLDPVWGGAYQASIAASVKDVPERFRKLMAIPEKRIGNQANALIAFSEAYKLTADERYRKAAAEIDRYLNNWMLSPEHTWYANQKDEPEDLPANWWPQDYWLLDSDEKRRRFAIPPIDHAVYTDKNAEVISGYVRAWEVFGNDRYLQRAVAAANSLIAERLQPSGWIRQSVENAAMSDDQRVHPHSEEVRPFLRSQAQFGQALLDLYQASGDSKWLGYATSLGDAMLEQLYDVSQHGFFATSLDETARLIAPRKPLEDNAMAAAFFYDLHILTKDRRYQPIAEATLRAVATPEILAREGKMTGKTALLLEKLTAAYVEFSVVGDPAHNQAKALYRAGLVSNHPRKLLHFEKPGRYPDMGRPVMFICNPDRCSLPVTSVEEVARTAATFRAGASSL